MATESLQAGERIVVTVASDGGTSLRVEGRAGSSCQSLTRDLERALGLVTRDQKTIEFHQGQHQHHSQNQGAPHAQR
jgi:hypothetical protein